MPHGIGDFVSSFKGDEPGHPFRGNQYEGGSGGRSSAIDNARTALDDYKKSHANKKALEAKALETNTTWMKDDSDAQKAGFRTLQDAKKYNKSITMQAEQAAADHNDTFDSLMEKIKALPKDSEERKSLAREAQKYSD